MVVTGEDGLVPPEEELLLDPLVAAFCPPPQPMNPLKHRSKPKQVMLRKNFLLFLPVNNVNASGIIAMANERSPVCDRDPG
jgi:hypothetical protein